MPCDHAVHVCMEDRHYIVEYDAGGEVLRIKRRETYTQYGVVKVFDTSYWTAKSHVLGSGLTMPKRIIELARQKKAIDASRA